MAPHNEPPIPQDQRAKRRAAKEVVDVLEEISTLLNTGLTRTQLSLAISLIENGVNPEALAAVIKELRAEGERAMGGSESQEEGSEG